MRRALGVLVLAIAAVGSWAVWSGRISSIADLMDTAALLGKSPHQTYADRLRSAGLSDSPLGRRWLDAADAALRSATPVAVPHVEARWFAASAPAAMAFRATARRGQRLVAEAAIESEMPLQVFVDLFVVTDRGPEHAASAERDAARLSLDVDSDATYLVRVQPEILEDVRVTLTWRVEPTLTLPVRGATRSSIQSYFLALRDGGRREHHGVDIFAPRGTPVLAAGSGLVTSVGTNALGGNVVWVARPFERESHYYAHLDTQTVTVGTRVDTGDELGTVGTTGNARGGPPHLHFGIYARMPVDPLPYLAPPPSVAAIRPDQRLGTRARLTGAARLEAATPSQSSGATPAGTVVDVVGLASGRLRVRLPDGTEGYVAKTAIVAATEPVRTLRLTRPAPLTSKPAGGVTVAFLDAPLTVDVMGTFRSALLVRTSGDVSGWLQP